MGADLYLTSVMNDAYATYRPARRLAAQAYRLAKGDPAARLHRLAGDLFEAVGAWFSSSGTFDAPLYDLVIQVRDLCTGESSVWLQDLSAQLLREVRALAHRPDAGERAQALLALVQQISDLTHGREAQAVLALIDEIGQQIAASPLPGPRSHDPSAGIGGIGEGATAPGGEAQHGQRALPVPSGGEGGVQPLPLVVQKMRNLARGIALDALADLASFLLGQEHLQHALCLRLDAKLGALVVRLQRSAQAVTTDAASLPLMAASLQHALTRWREFVEDYSRDLRARLEEMRAVAGGGAPDMSPEAARELIGRMDELAQGVLQKMAGWHELVQERGMEMARILNEAGVELPQQLPSLEIDEDLMPATSDQASGGVRPGDAARVAGEDEGPGGSSPGPEEALPELMERCMRASLQCLLLVGGSLDFFASAAGKVRQLADGQTSLLLQVMAHTFVERVRPPTADAEEIPEPEPIAGGDAMDAFWYQFQRGAREALAQAFRQHQEEEADQSPDAVFALAIELRALVGGDPSRRFQTLARRLAEALGEPAGAREAAEPGPLEARQVASLARQVCGLLQGDPRERLRALTPHLLDALRAADAQAPLAIARQMEELLQGRMMGQVRRLLHELVEYLQGQDAVPETSRAQVAERAHEVRTLLDGDPADQVWSFLRAALLHIVTRLERLRDASHDAHAHRFELSAKLAALLEGGEAAETDWGQVQEIWPHLVEALSQHVGEQPTATEAEEERRPSPSLLEQAKACSMCLAPEAGLKRDELFSIIIAGLLRRVVDELDDLEWPQEGHFRDNYNETSALWAARWFWLTDVAPLVETDALDSLPEIHWWPHEHGICGLLPIPAIRQLYQRVQEAEPVFPTREKLLRWRLRVDEEGEYSLEGWHARLRERRQGLLAFLDGALRREEPILCSL